MRRILNILLLAVLQAALVPISCFSQKPVLRAGIAKVNITPDESLYMGGYDASCRMGPSDGHFGNIYARALVFDDGLKRLAFIELDLMNLRGNAFDTIRKQVSDETGIPYGNIMLGCVHNHASPSLDRRNSDSQWYKQFNNKVVEAVKNAIDDLEPVKIGGGTGTSHIAMNRRKRMSDTTSYTTFDENNSSQSYGEYKTDHPVLIREVGGVYRLGANPEGSIDEEVGVMRIDDMSGKPIGVLVNYACHGTSLGGRNNTISPEWNGHMLEYIEKTLPGVTGIFIQGAAGDINPRFVGGLDGYKDDLHKTAELGYEIGREVVRVLEDVKTDLPVDPMIEIREKDIVCPLKYDQVVKDFRHTTVSVPITAIRIDDFAWVTFPGELFHEIGQKIKAGTHARYAYLYGYCNGSLGYLPTQHAFGEGGYEPWSSRFAPVTEKVLLKGIDDLLITMH
jgi:neutral ceramidase